MARGTILDIDSAEARQAAALLGADSENDVAVALARDLRKAADEVEGSVPHRIRVTIQPEVR